VTVTAFEEKEKGYKKEEWNRKQLGKSPRDEPADWIWAL
jgi:hypothetical protein